MGMQHPVAETAVGAELEGHEVQKLVRYRPVPLPEES